MSSYVHMYSKSLKDSTTHEMLWMLWTVSCPPLAAHGSSQHRPQRTQRTTLRATFWVVKHVKLQT